MIVPTLPNADSLDHAAAASACCFRPASTTNIYTVSAAAVRRCHRRRHSVPRRCHRRCTDRLESLLQREITEIDSQVSTSCCTYSTSTNNFWSYYYTATQLLVFFHHIMIPKLWAVYSKMGRLWNAGFWRVNCIPQTVICSDATPYPPISSVYTNGTQIRRGTNQR